MHNVSNGLFFIYIFIFLDKIMKNKKSYKAERMNKIYSNINSASNFFPLTLKTHHQ